MDVVRETDSQFGSGRRQRHERVPGRGALAGARPEAHIPFAHPGARSQFGWVVVQGNVRMRQHPQQAALLGARLGNPLVQRLVACDGREQRLQLPRQSRRLRRCRLLPIRQQLVVVGPEALHEGLQQRLVVRDGWQQLLIVPPFMHPAQRQLLGDQGKLRRVIAHQQAHHGKLHVGVIGCHGRRVQDPLPLLRPQAGQVRLQHSLHRHVIHEHTTGQLPCGVLMDDVTMQAVLETHLPGLGPQQRKWILDATAVAAYHADVEFPVVRLLVCDDAPQFTLVTEELALCWVHEGRHYKKLMPYISRHRALVEAFVQRFWTYYDQLLAYRERPTAAAAARLEGEFEALFATITGYDALDERIAKTQAKKDCLLMVLTHPEIPLHNNPAELGARARVRKRDVSFGPRTPEGAKAWDTFMTLAETATKLGVSFYHYIHDRVSGISQIPALADTIEERAKTLNLGASWNTS